MMKELIPLSFSKTQKTAKNGTQLISGNNEIKYIY